MKPKRGILDAKVHVLRAARVRSDRSDGSDGSDGPDGTGGCSFSSLGP